MRACSYTVKNIRTSTDILWRAFHILTESDPYTFVSVNRRNNESRAHVAVWAWAFLLSYICLYCIVYLWRNDKVVCRHTGGDDLAEDVDDGTVPAAMSELVLALGDRQLGAVPHAGHVFGVTSTHAPLPPAQCRRQSTALGAHQRRRRRGHDDLVARCHVVGRPQMTDAARRRRWTAVGRRQRRQRPVYDEAKSRRCILTGSLRFDGSTAVLKRDGFSNAAYSTACLAQGRF